MKRLSPGVRFLLGFITFLLCIALFVTTFVGILIADVVQILSSQENLEGLLRQVLFVDMQHPASTRHAPGGNASVLKQAPVKTFAPSDIRFSEPQTATSMVEWIYEALAEDFGDELQVDLETVKDFVERSTLDDFLVEKGAGLLNDLYTGENTVTLGADEVKAKIEENAALIEEVFGVPVDTQVITDVTTIIEENEYVERIEEEGILNIIMNPTGDATSNPEANPDSIDVEQVVNTARTALSVTSLLMVGGIFLLLIALILLTNMKQIWVGLNAVGITLMVAALPTVALTIAIWTVPAGWAAQLGLPAMAEILARSILDINSVICISIFALGYVLLMSGIITKVVVRKRAQKAETVNELEEAVIAEEPLPEVEFPTEEEIAEEEIDVDETSDEDEEIDEDIDEEDEAEEEAEEETV